MIAILALTSALPALLPGPSPAPADPPPPPPGAVRFTAELPADLAVGSETALRLEVDIAEAWSSSGGGIPQPILQIDVPPSVELAGKVLTTPQELARNEFLQAPYERLVAPGATTIGLTLKREPGPDERLGLNVLTFLGSPDGEDAWFVRRRIELPLKPGASATSIDRAVRSSWGPDEGSDAGLQIGDAAPDFELPRADGSTVRLSRLLAEGPVIVTTYRAFW